VDSETNNIHQSLQKLIGLHRQLLETVRLEREALKSADLAGIEEATRTKEALIAAIAREEIERLKSVAAFAVAHKRKVHDCTLQQIILEVQATDIKASEQMRSAFNALTILIQRIREQNEANKILVEESLLHVSKMKGNVIGERAPKTEVYTSQGKKAVARTGKSGLLSREA
jgi:flagellar biosynthesis/type III secretory pathway chaperone